MYSHVRCFHALLKTALTPLVQDALKTFSSISDQDVCIIIVSMEKCHTCAILLAVAVAGASNETYVCARGLRG